MHDKRTNNSNIQTIENKNNFSTTRFHQPLIGNEPTIQAKIIYLAVESHGPGTYSIASHLDTKYEVKSYFQCKLLGSSRLLIFELSRIFNVLFLQS
jgi:hypothetical protein